MTWWNVTGYGWAWWDGAGRGLCRAGNVISHGAAYFSSFPASLYAR